MEKAIFKYIHTVLYVGKIRNIFADDIQIYVVIKGLDINIHTAQTCNNIVKKTGTKPDQTL